MKCIFIIPYFGKLPSNINVWLKSVEYNKEWKFRIYTDDQTIYNYPPNVEVIYITFDKFSSLIKEKFDFNISIDNPRKLCDLKPAYGYIFEDSIKDYKFWGYCDIDVVLGNLNFFITQDILNKNEKLFSHGHMTIFKNNFENNRRFMNNIEGYTKYTDILSSSKNYIFDEPSNDLNINRIFKSLGISVHVDYSIFDINPYKYLFKRSLYDYLTVDTRGRQVFDENIYKQILLWRNGELKRYYIKEDKVYSEPIRYVHFQKRNMKVCIDSVSRCNSILIVPNKFIPFDGNVNKDIILKYTKNKIFYLQFFKLKIKNIKRKILSYLGR